jgi:hypothetical protein
MKEQTNNLPEQSFKEFTQKQREGLEAAVADRRLNKRMALNGEMYLLHLETGDIPVAIATSNGVIFKGDVVTLSRHTGGIGKKVEATFPIEDFYIPQDGNEIDFHRTSNLGEIPSMLRIDDIIKNHSAILRWDKMQRGATD